MLVEAELGVARMSVWGTLLATGVQSAMFSPVRIIVVSDYGTDTPSSIPHTVPIYIATCLFSYISH
jgi:hypothetical protein